MYQKINIPINMGTDLFSPECGYFLGAILSTNESYCDGNKRFWLAPIRHNRQQVSIEKLDLHEKLIKENLKRLNGRIYTKETLVKKKWFPSNKIGFATVFESQIEVDINNIISPLLDIFNNITLDALRSFIVGSFDGRGYLDINSNNQQIRYLALDVENKDVASFLLESLKKFNLRFNYNQPRDREEGGQPRKAQVRIPGGDMPVFMDTIGFISPCKFEQIQTLIDSKLIINRDDEVLFGLKSLRSKQKEAKFIISISDEYQKLESFEDANLLDDINNTTFQQDVNKMYSAVPKEKMTTISIKDKLIYKRDKKTAINALTIADFKCEIDNAHPSFIRRKSDILYTEPHHLVPMAYQDLFDVSLDIEENIVSLCSNCHNQIHYGKDNKSLLFNLYEQRKHLLKTVGISINFQELLSMYE